VDVYGEQAGLATITIDFSIRPIRGEFGEIEYLLPEGRNITERKQAEEEVARQSRELRVLNERLKELDRLKTQFFANVSHEFRTPLTLMLGPLEDALANAHGILPLGAAADLAASHRNALRLLKLVNTMLDFSRIEAGRVQASYQPVDLAAFTAELASNFRSACEKAGFRLTAPALIPEPAWASPSASGSSNAPAGASGLSPSSAEVQRFSLRSPAAKKSGTEPSEKPVFIFLAEDNPADAGLVRRALEEHGVEGELIVIADGEKAIRFIQALDHEAAPCPHLAIVGLNLPKKPGREVLERMRLSERCRHIPVVILSSSDAERDKADAARFGASRYICKPSKLDDFLSLGLIFKAGLSEPGR